MINLLTVFIPAYNEQDNLDTCIHELIPSLENTGTPFEILIVNDASSDQTGDLAEQWAQRDERIRVVHHTHNLGIGGGFCTAVEKAHGDWLLLIPADLALDVADIHLYLDASEQADVIVGLRSNRNDYSFFRKLVSWLNIQLIRFLFKMPQHQFQFISMYRLVVLRKMKIKYWHSAFFLAEILIKAKALGKCLVEVEIRYIPRKGGRATGVRGGAIFITLRDMLRFWLRWVRYGPKGVVSGQI